MLAYFAVWYFLELDLLLVCWNTTLQSVLK
jgi:hypothetical protein